MKPQLVNAAQQANLAGDRACETTVGANSKRLQVAQLGDARADGSSDLTIVKIQSRQRVHVINLFWDRSCERVEMKAKIKNVGHLGELRRNRARKLVSVNPELLELAYVAKDGRNSAAEVVPRPSCIRYYNTTSKQRNVRDIFTAVKPRKRANDSN